MWHIFFTAVSLMVSTNCRVFPEGSGTTKLSFIFYKHMLSFLFPTAPYGWIFLAGQTNEGLCVCVCGNVYRYYHAPFII